MSYVLIGTLGTGILTWPLFQETLPASWGDWPLTVTVMVFTLAVLRVISVMLQSKDDQFSERMVAKDEAFAQTLQKASDKHAAAVEMFAKTLLQVQTDGHAHGDKMRKSIDRMASAAEKLNKRK